MSGQWRDELRAFTRAFAGAAVFGIPLVMTMEMWWIGKTLPITHIMLLLFIGFLANLGLAHVSGFRDDTAVLLSVDEALDALAVGIVSALILLITLNQVRIADGVAPAVGMVMLLSVPLSIGASVARHVFSGSSDREGSEGEAPLASWKSVASDLGATAIGSVFLGLPIAPTEEIKMIAAGLTWWHVYAVIGLSLMVSYIIVFASGFDADSPPGAMHHPFTETTFAYAISLTVAFLLLLVFERIDVQDPFIETMRQTVVLALPASVGGAAGRLVI